MELLQPSTTLASLTTPLPKIRSHSTPASWQTRRSSSWTAEVAVRPRSKLDLIVSSKFKAILARNTIESLISTVSTIIRTRERVTCPRAVKSTRLTLKCILVTACRVKSLTTGWMTATTGTTRATFSYLTSEVSQSMDWSHNPSGALIATSRPLTPRTPRWLLNLCRARRATSGWSDPTIFSRIVGCLTSSPTAVNWLRWRRLSTLRWWTGDRRVVTNPA